MAKAMAQGQLREFALIGARQRYQELQRELASLVAAFPEVGRGAGRAAAPRAKAAPARRRRKMSEVERKAVSERMRKYWADRRKQKTKGEK